MILIGTDFSPSAMAALQHAHALAQKLGMQTVLLHVQSRAGRGIDEDARVWLRQARVREEELVMRHGTVWIELLRDAAEQRAALIVVGSHGQSGYQGIAPGSTTARLIVRSTVPIIVVPHPRQLNGEASQFTSTHNQQGVG